ncbi:MAG: RNA pseudouridine synthase, partial [Desulfamplus sp.]|nr:RNA pseudouridine synthase [Desulfamplus sp.]
MKIEFLITRELDGNRLDCAVVAKFTEHSRSLITQLIKDGNVLVSGKIKKP